MYVSLHGRVSRGSNEGSIAGCNKQGRLSNPDADPDRVGFVVVGLGRCSVLRRPTTNKLVWALLCFNKRMKWRRQEEKAQPEEGTVVDWSNPYRDILTSESRPMPILS